MSIKEQLQTDMKDALRAGDRPRLGTIRMANAAIQQHEIDQQTTLDDAGVVGIIQKMIKQRAEAADQYRDAGREDLESRERAEIEVLRAYLPEPLSEAEVAALVDEVIADTGADGMKDMGKVMGQLKSRLEGRADMGAVSALVRARLA